MEDILSYFALFLKLFPMGWRHTVPLAIVAAMRDTLEKLLIEKLKQMC